MQLLINYTYVYVTSYNFCSEVLLAPSIWYNTKRYTAFKIWNYVVHINDITECQLDDTLFQLKSNAIPTLHDASRETCAD